MRNPFGLMCARFSDYRSNIHIRRGKRILSRARSDFDRLNDFVDQLAEHYGWTFYQQLRRYCIRYEKAHFEFDRAFIIVASTCSALVLIPGLTGIIFGLIKMDSNASLIGASTAFVVLFFFSRINTGVTESGDRVRTYFYLKILLLLIALSASRRHIGPNGMHGLMACSNSSWAGHLFCFRMERWQPFCCFYWLYLSCFLRLKDIALVQISAYFVTCVNF